MASIEIKDLTDDITITEDEIKHVKGGPAYLKLGDIKGEVYTSTSYKINVELDGTTLIR